MKARFVDLGTRDPLTTQAGFHGIALCMEEGDDPVLTTVIPDAPYVSIGTHQELEKEVDVDYCRENGLPVYRRHVGGGAVLLDPGQLFFHFVAPTKSLPTGDVEELFKYFIDPVLTAYADLGVEAEFRPVNDVHVSGRKIGGTGAGRLGDATIFAGSFMMDFDPELMAEVLRVPSEKFRDKLHQSLKENITYMERELDETPSSDDIKRAFRAAVEEELGWELRDSELIEEEWGCVEEMRKRLSDPDWLHRRGREMVPGGAKIQAGTRLTEGRHKAAGGLVRATLLEKDCRVEDVLISGDFTLLPEDGIGELHTDSRIGVRTFLQRRNVLHDALVGTELDEEKLAEAAAEGMRGLETPGVEPRDVAEAVMAAGHG